MSKVVRLAAAQKNEECFLRIDGPPEGYGPFHVEWKGVSAQMILVLESTIAQLKTVLHDIIQEEGKEE